MAEKKMKNPCWKGYEAYGMKKKNGKEVPNCVPMKEDFKQKILSKLLVNEGEEVTVRTGRMLSNNTGEDGTLTGSNFSFINQRIPGVSIEAYRKEMDAARAKAKYTDTSELPTYTDKDLARETRVYGSDFGVGKMMGKNIIADFTRSISGRAGWGDQEETADQAASARSVITAQQFRDSMNLTAQRKDLDPNKSIASQMPANSDKTARAIGDKAAMARLTDKPLMPLSTSDKELDDMLDRYEKNTQNATAIPPKDKKDTLERIKGYRTIPAERERLRLSQNDKNESDSVAVAESFTKSYCLKEQIKQTTKQRIIEALLEGKNKPQFEKREGNLSQRPKQFGKGGKAGTERTQDRREGKREAQDHD